MTWVRAAVRWLAWVAWGAALLVVPALGQAAFETALGVSGAPTLPLAYHLWTTAIPCAFVAAAFAHALRERLVGARRALGVAALVALALYLITCTPWFLGDVDLARAVDGLKVLLRYLVWCLWGALLPLWVAPAPQEGSAAPSPLDGIPGAEELTERERAVAELLVTGSTPAQAAEALGISASSVGTYRSRACEKLGVSSLATFAAQEVGAAALPRALDVASPVAPALALMALCVGVLLHLLTGLPAGGSLLGDSLDVIVLLGVLAVPWAALVFVARLRGLRVKARPVTGRFGLVLGALAVLGLLAGGRNGVFVSLPSGSMVSAGALAAPVYVVCVAVLSPYLTWPEARETTMLDAERCVLYLRGRGAGELQARVLTEIALGRSAPEICEGLHVARGTVNAYRAQGYELLGVHSARELADLLARDVGRVPSAGKTRPPAEEPETSE